MKNPKISVILPVYNAELFLEEAIDSILNQTIDDFELIIINDGSTDNSEKIIMSYNDVRIVYIKNPSNLKLIKTLNIGVDVTKGKYISRMDADDIAFPKMFEKQMEIFDQKKEVDIVNIRSFIMSQDGITYRKSKTVIKVNSDVHQHVVFFQNLISHPGVMLKAHLLKEFRYMDNDMVNSFEDADLWCRILKSGVNCYTTDEYLLFYRNTLTGIINTERKKSIPRRLAYCKGILGRDGFSNFKDKEIEMILGNYTDVNYKDLNDLSLSLSNYLIYIRTNKNISSIGFYDLNFWKNHLIFFTSIKSLESKKNIDKIFIILFILKQFPVWMRNRKWRKNVVEILTFGKNRIIREAIN